MSRLRFNAIEKYNMLEGCSGIVAGVSGGADSMALIHMLKNIAKDKKINLYATHINHLLRGEEADRDEEFVRKFCKDNGIELFVLRADVKEAAKKKKLGLEECGRAVRYEFFNNCALKTGAEKIALAHTMSDSAETMIFNLIRGAGLKGLCGIQPKRDNIIRPLIFCTREDIEDYCKENKIEYITDSSNLSDDYTRNRIRNTLIPIIKEINPSYIESFYRLSQAANEDEEFLTRLSRKALADADFDGSSFKTDVLKNQEKSISIRTLREVCVKAFDITPDYNKINGLYNLLINGKTSDKFQIKGSFFAYIKYGRFYTSKIKGEKPSNFELVLIEGSNILNDGRIVYIEKTHIINSSDTKTCLDYDKIKGDIIARTRKTGDYFTPKSKQGGKSLKKLFIDYKIDEELRNNAIVLCDDSGIIWVQHLGVSKEKALDRDSKSALKIILKQVNE